MADFLGIDKLSFPTGFMRKAKLIHTIHHTYNTLRHNPGLHVNDIILAYIKRKYPSLR